MLATTNRSIGEPGSDGSDDALREKLTLYDRLGAPLMSRLFEMCLMIEVRADDYRRLVKRASHHRPVPENPPR